MRQMRDELGFSLIDVLVAIAIIGIVAMLATPTLVDALDRSRQRKSLGEMRQVGMALAASRIDTGGYPAGTNTLNQLVPDHLVGVPNSGWETDFLYIGINGGCGYLLLDTAADGLFGPVPPDPWTTETYDPDLWYVNGAFLQAPGLETALADLGPVLLAAC